jgi:putative cofactor-binding repeat protein
MSNASGTDAEAGTQLKPNSDTTQRHDHYVPGRWKFTDCNRRLKLPCYLLDNSVNVKDFFGRKDVLDAIDKTLLVPDGMEVMSELKTFAICGIGGIGRYSRASVSITDLTKGKPRSPRTLYNAANRGSTLSSGSTLTQRASWTTVSVKWR